MHLSRRAGRYNEVEEWLHGFTQKSCDASHRERLLPTNPNRLSEPLPYEDLGQLVLIDPELLGRLDLRLSDDTVF